MDSDNLMLGTGLHILLGPYRDAVVDKKHGLELQKAVNKVSKLGYTIVGKHYKRIPSGYDDTHKNSQFLLYNGLAAMHQNEISEGLLSDRIVDYAFSHFKKMSPIHKRLSLDNLGREKEWLKFGFMKRFLRPIPPSAAGLWWPSRCRIPVIQRHLRPCSSEFLQKPLKGPLT
jgi:hypothetical protein